MKRRILPLLAFCVLLTSSARADVSFYFDWSIGPPATSVSLIKNSGNLNSLPSPLAVNYIFWANIAKNGSGESQCGYDTDVAQYLTIPYYANKVIGAGGEGTYPGDTKAYTKQYYPHDADAGTQYWWDLRGQYYAGANGDGTGACIVWKWKFSSFFRWSDTYYTSRVSPYPINKTCSYRLTACSSGTPTCYEPKNATSWTWKWPDNDNTCPGFIHGEWAVLIDSISTPGQIKLRCMASWVTPAGGYGPCN